MSAVNMNKMAEWAAGSWKGKDGTVSYTVWSGHYAGFYINKWNKNCVGGEKRPLIDLR